MHYELVLLCICNYVDNYTLPYQVCSLEEEEDLELLVDVPAHSFSHVPTNKYTFFIVDYVHVLLYGHNYDMKIKKPYLGKFYNQRIRSLLDYKKYTYQCDVGLMNLSLFLLV